MNSKKFPFLAASIITTVLLCLYPISMLMLKHSWADVLDKIILIVLVAAVSFANFKIQAYYHRNKTPYKIAVVLGANVLLFVVTSLIRYVFFLNTPDFQAPPILIILITDAGRVLLMAIIAYILIRYYDFYQKQIENNLKISNLENQNLHLQLHQLTAQLQPHFFFNSLNVLSELIYSSPQKSEAYIEHLSKIFRYLLNHQNTTFVALSEEIHFIQSYLYLLEIRFGEALQVNFDISQQEAYEIPALCTIAVLENIVKHNALDGIVITIKISEKEKMLIISNSIHPKNNIQSLGVGLANINKKCALLLERNISILQTKNQFEVGIPLKPNER